MHRRNLMMPRVGRPAFVGWFMLLVVLISAVPTTGQARTRVIGSAFDPATYSVVVSPKKPRVAGAKTTVARKPLLDHLFDGVPVPAIVEPQPLPFTFEWASQLRFEAPPEQPAGRPSIVRAHGPRAPPTT
ncbi:hypothetical protein KK137_08725 [Croceibacterium sp. LX-88]|uniref:Uncharacterized protein n=1 Tax=Croceibacterium selenioxidans TaxID=2838833 RepID=A0ABS5W3Y5_9SPHN|nr:hypothetical protein [Croceibacterium selenioxidans]MBT2134414.1 hypothetical protein [Croceibacterium selenioxidans]